MASSAWLESVRTLVNDVQSKLESSIANENDAPPELDLVGTLKDEKAAIRRINGKESSASSGTSISDPASAAQDNLRSQVSVSHFRPYIKVKGGGILKHEVHRVLVSEAGKEQGEDDRDEDEDSDPALMQFADMICWSAEQVEPDPGQVEQQAKYIPIDPTLIPKRARTREEAIHALRTCDRLCSLVENQKHCIKNHKLVIASLIQHVLTEVVPVPKPRAAPKDRRVREKQDSSMRRRVQRSRVVLVALPSVASATELAQVKSFFKEDNHENAAVNEGGEKKKSSTVTAAAAGTAPAALSESFSFFGSLLAAASHIADSVKLDHEKKHSLLASALPNCSWLGADLRVNDDVDAAIPLFTVLSMSTPREARNAVKALKCSKFHAEDRFRAVLWHEASITLRVEPRYSSSNNSSSSNHNNDNDNNNNPAAGDRATHSTVSPNFSAGHKEEQEFSTVRGNLNAGLSCIWNAPVTYGDQLEVACTLHRIMEHFAAAAISIPQSRSFDAVCVIVPGVLAALIDVMLRCAATDHPSAVCTHLLGQTTSGKQLGCPGYGIDVGSFAVQTETMEIHVPELVVARTAVLDYFRSPEQKRLLKIFNWEDDYDNKPTRPLIKYLRAICRESARSTMPSQNSNGGGVKGPFNMLLDNTPTSSEIQKDYPEFYCLRDISFWWKFFLNPDITSFPHSLAANGLDAPRQFTRMEAQLYFQWNNQKQGYRVYSFGSSYELHCAPDPDQYLSPKELDKVKRKQAQRHAKATDGGGNKNKPKKDGDDDKPPLPTQRWPSTATPSFYVEGDPIRGEDDIIYRRNLPTFGEDDEDPNDPANHHLSLIFGQEKIKSYLEQLCQTLNQKKSKWQKNSDQNGGDRGAAAASTASSSRKQAHLSQRDSELLLSYLTVPYLRVPLVLTFFASNDRVHKLGSKKLRRILDSVLFEPQRCLQMDATGVAPVMVPTLHPQLLASPFGLLMNELVYSPQTILRCVEALLRSALALDTGNVASYGSDSFSPAVDIILYASRIGARVDNFVTFVLNHFGVDWKSGTTSTSCASGGSGGSVNGPLRGVNISTENLSALFAGGNRIRGLLQDRYSKLFEDYLSRLHHQTEGSPDDEGLVDRNTRLACDLHAHKLLLFRNGHAVGTVEETTETTVASLLSSFVFLTGRHTFNTPIREKGALLVPESEVYELLSHVRHALVRWAGTQKQGPIDRVMQTALQVSTSSAGSLRASADVIDAQNRWSRIKGRTSPGRFAVSSTRTIAVQTEEEAEEEAAAAALVTSSTSKRTLLRQASEDSVVTIVQDTRRWGVEMDLQLGQMTLRSRHLSALPSDVANHPDVLRLFGEATIQASTLEEGEHRKRYRLVGLGHELQYWHTEHKSAPPVSDEWERQYDPSELYPSEKWIASIFEPVRRNMYNGPQPPAMTFMMPEQALADDAEVAVLLGLHQKLGGPYKLVYIFRRFKCLHIYECLSQGREFWFGLHLTTDNRYTLHDMQPSTRHRKQPLPEWWKRGAGTPYPTKGPLAFLYNDISNPKNSSPTKSVLIVRDASHNENLSGGLETYVPPRLLHGLVPGALLEQYRFWQDETSKGDMRGCGQRVLRGYPLDSKDNNTILFVEMGPIGSWEKREAYIGGGSRGSGIARNKRTTVEITGFPGRAVRIFRRAKIEVEREFRHLSLLASIIESAQLLRKPRKSHSGRHSSGGIKLSDLMAEENDEAEVPKFFAEEIIMAFEVKHEQNRWFQAQVETVNDSGTYDITFNDPEWYQDEKDVPASRMRKLPRGSSAEKLKGMGVWAFDSMSESDAEDWRSDEDVKESPKDADASAGSREKRSRQKQKLNFRQFWELLKIVHAVGGNKSLSISLLRTIAGLDDAVVDVDDMSDQSDVPTFESIKALSSHMAHLPEALDETSLKSQRKLDCERSPMHKKTKTETIHVLLNMMYAPRRTRLHSLAKTLARVENLSHICAWTRLDDPVGNMESIAQMKRDRVSTWGCPNIDLIELPRLKLTLAAKRDSETGTMRLYSVDHADLFISNTRDARAVKLLNGIPHSLILQNSQGEMHILVPVVKPTRPMIQTQPFTTRLVLERADKKWNSCLSQRYYLYPIHVSMSFLMTKGLDSALYLLLLRFLHREYASSFRLSDAVATDSGFSSAGAAIWRNLCAAAHDFHPDAHAVRMKLSLVTIDSGSTLPWNLTAEAARYIMKMSHISAECRISRGEELQILTNDSIVLDRQSPNYDPNIDDLYLCTLVKNRRAALAALAANDVSSREGEDGTTRAPCWIPPGVPASGMWPYYRDNSVFGERYNEVISVDSMVEYRDLINDGFDGALTLVCLHVRWSSPCVRAMRDLEQIAPSIPFVRILSVRADNFEFSSIVEEFSQVKTGSAGKTRTEYNGDSKQPDSKEDEDEAEDEESEGGITIKTFPTWILTQGPRTELGRIKGHVRAGERLNALIKNASTSEHLKVHRKREKAQLCSLGLGGAGKDGDDTDDANEEMQSLLQWIWDFDNCGPSLLVENYGYSCTFSAQAEADDPTRVKWEWALTKAGKSVTYDPSLDWKELTSPAAEALEEHHTEGFFHSGEETCYLNGEEFSGGARTAVYENSMDYSKANMMTGLYASLGRNFGSNKYVIFRRRGPYVDVPGAPEQSPQTKRAQKKAAQDAEKQKAMMKKLKAKRRDKDAEVIRGTLAITKGSGVHSWKLKWQHQPQRGGEFDCLGLCSKDFDHFGPASPPLLGKAVATEGTKLQSRSLGLYASGKLLIDGETLAGVVIPERSNKRKTTSKHPAEKPTVESAVSAAAVARVKKTDSKQKASDATSTELKNNNDNDDNVDNDNDEAAPLLFERGATITVTFDSDTEGGLLTFKVDERNVEGCDIKDVFSLLQADTLFPCVGICPFVDPEEQKREAEASKKANGEAEGFVQDELETARADAKHISNITGTDPEILMSMKPSQRAEVLRKAKLKQMEKNRPIVTIVVERSAAEKKLDTLDKPGRDADGNDDVEEDDPFGSSLLNPDAESNPADKRAVWMYQTSKKHGWEQYDEDTSKKLESAFNEFNDQPGHQVSIRRKKKTLVVQLSAPDFATESKSGGGGFGGGSFGGGGFDCSRNDDDDDGESHYPRQLNRSGAKFVPVKRLLVSKGPSGAWEMLSLTYRPPMTLRGKAALSVLNKVWSGKENIAGKKAGLGFLFLYDLFQGRQRCKVIGSTWSFWSSAPQDRKTDSHRFAILLAQLYKDRQRKSLLTSIINVMSRNRNICSRLPQFRDTRKNKGSAVFNGFSDESEPHSPLSNLLEEVVPMMKIMKRSKGALKFPPSPPHAKRPEPVEACSVWNDDPSKREWLRPELSNFSNSTRHLSKVPVSEIFALCKAVKYYPPVNNLPDGMQPQAPVLVEHPKQWKGIFDDAAKNLSKTFDARDGPAIVVADFFATWCGPCKQIAPIFRKFALEFPCIKFIKVDVDECEAIGKSQKIDSMPTFKVYKGSDTKCVGTVVGGGPKALQALADYILRALDDAEATAVHQFQEFKSGKSIPKMSGLLASLRSLATDQNSIDALASRPLSSVEDGGIVIEKGREDLGKELINGDLPFDLRPHNAAGSVVAKSMLTRMEKDIRWWADTANGAKTPKIINLLDHEVKGFFEQMGILAQTCGDKPAPRGDPNELGLTAILKRISLLLGELAQLRDCDVDFVAKCVPLMIHAANFVDLENSNVVAASTKAETGASSVADVRRRKVRFLLRRKAGQESKVWLEYMFGCLLSTCAVRDLQMLNPYLRGDTAMSLLKVVNVTLLRSNRIGQANRCIAAGKKLIKTLRDVLKTTPAQRFASRSTHIPKIIQHAEAVASQLTAARHYVTTHNVTDTSGNSSSSIRVFDPRYLVFEFTWNILLRKKQVTTVNDLLKNMKSGTSKVKQMIMGAGKTTVVAPLLALMLADGGVSRTLDRAQPRWWRCHGHACVKRLPR